MNRELAELIVKSPVDYKDKVVTALQDAGFIVVLRNENPREKFYIIAESEDKK